ncbi:MAG TPA: T9SS type A sorting domain-containing protein [Chitinophagales bacterium]|nr:T9SS type A sorting domain-containing protein [Chitinophagales bacterium]
MKKLTILLFVFIISQEVLAGDRSAPMPCDPTFTGLSSSYCLDAGSVMLIPVTAGGVFSGAGVTLFGYNYFFDPASAGPGTFTITYDLGGGCSSSQTTTVYSLPAVTLGGFPTVCTCSPPFILTGGLPAGGTYADQNGYVTGGNTFDPGLSGAGNFDIYYFYTDANGCTGVAQSVLIIESCSITTGTIAGSPFCPEAAVSVPFTSTGTYDPGNVYTAQLSNKKGSFTSPTSIGTLTSTANAGTINATIPSHVTAGTKYRIRVTSSSPSCIGSDNAVNFTLVACDKVIGLNASSITSNSATLSWTSVPCAVKFKIQYRIASTMKWTTRYSTTNSCGLTGLLTNTDYEYHVETYCSLSGLAHSLYTPVQTLHTLRLGTTIASTEKLFDIFPNPAELNTSIHLELTQASYVYIAVCDITGKEITKIMNQDLEQGAYSVAINISHYSKGIYIVKMISDSKIESQKLVVQ